LTLPTESKRRTFRPIRAVALLAFLAHTFSPVRSGADAPLEYPIGSSSSVLDAPRVPNADGALPISFRDLASFELVPLESKMDRDLAQKTIPDSIKKWNGKKVVIDGYMTPLKYTEGGEGVVEFLLVSRVFGCCDFGTPMVNEMVFVTMAKGKETEPFPDRIVTVTGKFRAEAETDGLGYLTGIYRIRGESVLATGPPHVHE
jgi:hypothetical protein